MADTPEPTALPGLSPAAAAVVDERRSAELRAIEAVVQRIRHTGDDGEFAILECERPGQPPFDAVGALAGIAVGESLRLSGTWENHPRFGRRLRVQQALPQEPRSKIGVERYLASLAGLGPETARRLVEQFGVGAIELLEKDTWRAAQIKGLSKRRAVQAAADAKTRREEREVMVFLQGHGVSLAYAKRIRKTYGDAAMLRVKADPYRLARDVDGIGFQIADRIAQTMGVEPLDPKRIAAGLVYTLDNATDGGHCFLPEEELFRRAVQELRLPAEGDPRPLLQRALIDLCATQEEPRDLLPPSTPAPNRKPPAGPAIVIEGEDIYPPRLHSAELALSRQLRRLRDAHRPPVPAVVESGDGGPSLAEGQRQALALVAESPVCVITGGPGTGKTTIIRRLVKDWEGAGCKVTLVAPTGRAAKRLSEATGRPAATVHRMLEWAPKEGFRRRRDNPLDTNLLVCDEASMLDLPLARSLANAVPEGATLLLVGDVDQLPSVGPGRVLADVIDSGAVPVARLSQIFRQAEGSGIVENAHRIRTGAMPLSAPPASPVGVGDFFLIDAEDPLAVRDLVLRCCLERIPQRFGLHPLRDIQVLTPMHRGDAGTEELNRALQAALNPPPAAPLGMNAPDGQGNAQELRRGGRAFRAGDKVMQVKNDYEKDVWNGDVGLVLRASRESNQLCVRYDDREVTYGAEGLDNLELAYAVSVHKSQGSEYPAVVIPLVMQHYAMLRRNLLYTAVTRGKRLVVIIGSRRALQRAVREVGDQLRYTRLAERLRDDL